jgi:hypothetical protein
MPAVAVFTALASTVSAAVIPPTPGDYGTNGSFTYRVDRIPSPNYSGQEVTVYRPTNSLGPISTAPTIFFSHGFGASNPATYQTMLTNLVSRGYNVVHSPYQSTGIDNQLRYDQMASGFEQAVSVFGLRTDKIGFIGHSIGGGSLPYMVQHLMMGANNGNTWGATAAFAFAMAPAQIYSLPDQRDIVLPSHLNQVVMVFNDDSIIDPLFGMDQYYNSTVPQDQKMFITLFSDDHERPALLAQHGTPTDPVINGLDQWGTLRHADALADYTFTGNPAAFDIALGTFSNAANFMGLWSDGVPVRPAFSTYDPNPADYPSSGYSVNWNSPLLNPRLAYTVPEVSVVIQAGLAMFIGLVVGWRSVAKRTGQALGA